ncbi:MAG: hypothetical protein HYS17_00025 [Micavibrio aeruginosavorus]|uniref:Uncharacterized protein n=1 Tax=Micavibrio aeruginosavorus TaxID=349221 RepID=A0A7T5R290_9BACT|nr:MAG: hypothetical protein HYS17_00025 [Micavibrio aeruginosavorus]
MRVPLKELMDKMGVGFVPGAYESVPWSAYDAVKGVTCSAEIRMGADADEIEGEIQFMYENPPAGKKPMEPVCFLRAIPQADGNWNVSDFKIRGESYGADKYNWEEKACTFFQMVVQELMAGEIPNIDDLLEEAFHSRDRFADQYGGGSSKSPKIKPEQMLNIKGRGF